jgi:hypothetical protein
MEGKFSQWCGCNRKIMNDRDTEKLQIDPDRLGGWVEENVMKITQVKVKL